VAHDISPGAPEGEGAGIARHDAPDHRRNRLQPAIFERKFATERDLNGHGTEITGISGIMLTRNRIVDVLENQRGRLRRFQAVITSAFVEGSPWWAAAGSGPIA